MLTGTLVVAAPVLAAEGLATERLKVSQTLPEEADDPLRKWFKEQDRLLDDILVRLARIENLVREIHQLIVQLPSGPVASLPAAAVSEPIPIAAPVTPPASAPRPAPSSAPAEVKPIPPVAVPTLPMPKQAPSGIFGFFDEWGSILAGIGLLLLVLMIGQRHRRNRGQPAQQADSTTAPEIHVEEPAFLLELDADNKTAPKVAAKSLAPVAPANPPPAATVSSIQRAGAMEPSKGHADQALELAEIMLSMGLGHGAVQTLTEQIRNEPKQALTHWLKLLEIYRQNGQQAEFEKSAEELRLHFNVQPEDWQVRPETQRSIEDYPHIAARICELWSRPACLVYLQNLLDDNRGGARSGFPQPVAEEFLLLTSMLKARGIAPDADAAIGD